MWSDPWGLRRARLQDLRAGKCFLLVFKVTHLSRAGAAALYVGLLSWQLLRNHHQVVEESLRLCCQTPFIYISIYRWLPERSAILKYTLEITFLEIWNDFLGLRTRFSFISRFLLNVWGQSEGTLPGSSRPNPHHSFPSFCRAAFLFSFWP